MNENLQPKTPPISQWIAHATAELAHVGIESAKLDAELILSHTLRKSRTYLHAHGEEQIDPVRLDIADARLQLRLERTPVAYIVGHKEFYGRLFHVSPATLIPRPESETMISLLKDLLPKTRPLLPKTQRLVDVGTGSGCLGITAKLEFPELEVTLLDISRHALTVAKKNARLHHADVAIRESDLLNAYPFKAQIILANLPYVDPSWERSPETEHEPDIALFAPDDGLQTIKRLVEQTSTRLEPHGLLLLEADPKQHQEIITFAKKHQLKLREISGFILALEKLAA